MAQYITALSAQVQQLGFYPWNQHKVGRRTQLHKALSVKTPSISQQNQEIHTNLSQVTNTAT